MSSTPQILVTAANGQLGRLVVSHLLKSVSTSRIAIMIRRDDPYWAKVGVRVTLGDYAKPATLDAAFQGVERVLMISSNAIGERVEQHRNVVAAAKRAHVQLLAYTSVLHAPNSPLDLAEDHRQTEAAIQASGLPHVFLRNGWYTENYTGFIAAALAHGAVIGSAGDGRVSSATRDDYAAAAARVLTLEPPPAGRAYELAGDTAFTLNDFAAEVSRQTGRTITYRNLPEADYEAALAGAGLPAPVAHLLAESSSKTATGTLLDEGRQLSALIGRPTTPLADSVAVALRSEVQPG